MINKILAIQLTFVVILSSVGFRVMHHHCIWCGGDRLELLASGPADCQEGSCCSPVETVQHTNHHQEGCCQEELVKIHNALISSSHQLIKKSTEKQPVVDFFPVPDILTVTGAQPTASHNFPKPLPPPLTNSFFKLNVMRC